MAAHTTPIDAPPRNPKLELNMQLYWKSIDWIEKWEIFRDTFGKTGLPTYKTIPDFIDKVIAPSCRAQEDFLEWYLGPDNGDEVLAKKYSFAGSPVDWKKKRETGGGWWNDEAKALAEKKIKAQVNALDFMKAHTDETLVGQSCSLARLQQEILRAIGPVLREDQPMEESMARVKKWVDVFKDVARLQQITQEMTLKSLGLDSERGDGVTTIIVQKALDGRIDQASEKDNNLKKFLERMQLSNLKKKADLGGDIDGLPPTIDVKSNRVDEDLDGPGTSSSKTSNIH